MANRRINKEIKAFITERAAYSSDTPASIYRQVKDKFENPCSIATVERTVRSVRQGLALYKLARTPTPLPNDEDLIRLREQGYGLGSLISPESYAVYDQMISMRQEIAELKKMIQLIGRVASLEAEDSTLDSICDGDSWSSTTFDCFYGDEEKDLARDYIEKEEKNW